MAELKIETFTDSNGETRFRVIAENGQITLTPHEGYTRKEDCHRAIVDNLGAIVYALEHGLSADGCPGILVVDEDGERHRLTRTIAHNTRGTWLGPLSLKPETDEEK